MLHGEWAARAVVSLVTRDELSESMAADGLELSWVHIVVLVVVIAVGIGMAVFSRRRLRRDDTLRRQEYAPVVHRETWTTERRPPGAKVDVVKPPIER